MRTNHRTAAGGAGQFVTLTDEDRNISQTLRVDSTKPLDFTALGITIQAQSSIPAGALTATAPASVTLGTTDGGLLAIDPGANLPFIREIFTYDDGKTEDHKLVNGEHVADYISRTDVPQSEFAFDLGGRQLRYLRVQPARVNPVVSVELVKGDDATAPIVMAITAEMP